LPGIPRTTNEESRLVSSNRLARILFIVDHRNWAQDFKTTNLARVLANQYDIRKLYQDEVTAEDLDRADVLVVYYWFQLEKMQRILADLRRNSHKLAMGVCSHSEIEGIRGEEGIATLRDWARCVFALNSQLYNTCQSVLEAEVFYTPGGVDTNFYQPATAKRPAGVMLVGWAGSLTNHGPDHRGYHDLIVPAVALLADVELVTAIREDVWRGLEDMREFYRSLDVYVCASRDEGSPNTCLEAAACGIPLVTTRVGNMPELVRTGVNGFLVERSVGNIASKLVLLRDDPKLRTLLGRNIHEDIQAWDWSFRSEAYREMFETILRPGRVRFSRRTQSITSNKESSKSPPASSVIVDDPQSVKRALLLKAEETLALIPDRFYEEHRTAEVTIIMLSYGRLEQTLNAIRALREHVRVPFKFLLIDNGSDDETKEGLRKAASSWNRVELLLLDENLGCAGGRMHGLDRVTTDYVLFIDNDIEVLLGTVEHLMLGLEMNPDAIGTAGNIIYPNGEVHLCGGEYSVRGGVFHFELLGAGQRFDESLGQSGFCEWIPGGLTLLRTAALQNNPYDLGLRSYYEDLEWCYRLNQMGIGCFYRNVEALAIHHHESKIPPASLPSIQRKIQSSKYVLAVAHFYETHGAILKSFFDFMPEFGDFSEERCLRAARIFLKVANACGIEWALENCSGAQLAGLSTPIPTAIQVENNIALIEALTEHISELAGRPSKAISLNPGAAIE
jgi:GT2 family glycosyltransferase/glycosyltransferase involved in cell wall biosynthesis